MNSPDSKGELRCEVTGYVGHEEAVLAARNASREKHQTREYLNWRYQVRGGGSPQVFWLSTAGQPEVLGIAAAIPRVFWVDGTRTDIFVIGDIGLHSEARGSGRGTVLLDYMTRELAKRGGARFDFVIPTEAAQRALARVGWRTAGSLVPHVLLLDLNEKLGDVIKSRIVARILGRIHRAALRLFLSAWSTRGHTIENGARFDDEHEEFWATFPKQGICLGERDAQTLRWRYSEHPERRFEVCKLRHGGRMCGYIISAREEREIVVYDLIATSNARLGALLTLFARRQLTAGVASIRVLVSDSHPYRRMLSRLGYVRRDASAVYQVHGSTPDPHVRWALTLGDKDI